MKQRRCRVRDDSLHLLELASLPTELSGFPSSRHVWLMNMFNLIIQHYTPPLLKQLQAIMDFSAVVDRARALHEQQGSPPPDTATTIPDCHSEQLLEEEVYGRICNSTDSNPPATLALPSSRKTGFVFGPDSISSIILRQNAYDALRSLGFDHDFIYNDVCKFLIWHR